MKNIKTYIIVAFLLITTLSSLYFYNQYKKTQKILDNLPKSVDETRQLLEKVEKLISLPKDEDPLIATVSDKDKLKNQPFFDIAENGDKVLIYTKSKKAILYRPSENRIIDVSFVNIKDNNTESTSSATLFETPTLSPAVTDITATTSPTVNPTAEKK